MRVEKYTIAIIAISGVTSLIIIFSVVSLSFLSVKEAKALEQYQGIATANCTFSYMDQIDDNFLSDCYYPGLDNVERTSEGNLPVSVKEELVLDPISASVVMHPLDKSRFWKSEVDSSTIPQERYDNVAEPSFASNGTLVFYTGNHFAARSVVDGDWEYIDPDFDFKGMIEPANLTASSAAALEVETLFKADQHVEYDPIREMYLWVRQGEQVTIGGGLSNIDRLAVSRDLDRWVAFDLVSVHVLNQAEGIIEGSFDYPDTVLTNRYLYLTTSVHTRDNAQYGLVFRFPLDELSNLLDETGENTTDINYEFFIDRTVKTITPVDGASNPMYFGSHLPDNTTKMKIYTWFDDSPPLNPAEVEITPWNSIKNKAVCDQDQYSEAWWCKANTSSRIRSAWMSDNSINFQWNAVASHDGGVSWVPYIDSATFHVDDSMRYERKYHLADPNNPWMFGAVSPNKDGDLGVGALYVDTETADSLEKPYINFAFGVYNDIKNKWEMMPVLNSSFQLPVIDEEGGIDDYNIGDFLTTRAHAGDDCAYSWDTSGYIIVGPNSYNIEPYYIMVKNRGGENASMK
jgi:hypothetical protein